MQTRAAVTAVVLAAGIPLVGCYRLEDFCTPSARVEFDAAGPSTLTRLAVGETRLFAATVPPHNGGPCQYEGRPFTHIEWTDSRNNTEKKVQIHLLTCTSCTPLYEDVRDGRSGVSVKGAALVNGIGGTHVVLEVKGSGQFGYVEFRESLYGLPLDIQQ